VSQIHRPFAAVQALRRARGASVRLDSSGDAPYEEGARHRGVGSEWIGSRTGARLVGGGGRESRVRAAYRVDSAGEAGRRRVLARYTQRAVAEATLAAYRAALGAGR
jgi:hypothetical protein